MPKYEIKVVENWMRFFHVEAESEEHAKELFNANQAKQVGFEQRGDMDDGELYIDEVDDAGEIVLPEGEYQAHVDEESGVVVAVSRRVNL